MTEALIGVTDAPKRKKAKSVRMAEKRINRNLTENYYKARASQDAHEKHRLRPSPSLESEKQKLALSLSLLDRQKHEREQKAARTKRLVGKGLQEDLEGWQ